MFDRRFSEADVNVLRTALRVVPTWTFINVWPKTFGTDQVLMVLIPTGLRKLGVRLTPDGGGVVTDSATEEESYMGDELPYRTCAQDLLALLPPGPPGCFFGFRLTTDWASGVISATVIVTDDAEMDLANGIGWKEYSHEFVQTYPLPDSSGLQKFRLKRRSS